MNALLSRFFCRQRFCNWNFAAGAFSFHPCYCSHRSKWSIHCSMRLASIRNDDSSIESSLRSKRLKDFGIGHRKNWNLRPHERKILWIRSCQFVKECNYIDECLVRNNKITIQKNSLKCCNNLDLWIVKMWFFFLQSLNCDLKVFISHLTHKLFRVILHYEEMFEPIMCFLYYKMKT